MFANRPVFHDHLHHIPEFTHARWLDEITLHQQFVGLLHDAFVGVGAQKNKRNAFPAQVVVIVDLLPELHAGHGRQVDIGNDDQWFFQGGHQVVTGVHAGSKKVQVVGISEVLKNFFKHLLVVGIIFNNYHWPVQGHNSIFFP